MRNFLRSVFSNFLTSDSEISSEVFCKFREDTTFLLHCLFQSAFSTSKHTLSTSPYLSQTCAIFFIWTTRTIESISTWTRNWTIQLTVSTATTQLWQNLILQVSEIYIWIINAHTRTFLSLITHIHSFIHSHTHTHTHTTGNKIESEGIQSLSEALKTNTTLTSLNLESEWIYIYE
jgi:hypothetical protein